MNYPAAGYEYKVSVMYSYSGIEQQLNWLDNEGYDVMEVLTTASSTYTIIARRPKFDS